MIDDLEMEEEVYVTIICKEFEELPCNMIEKIVGDIFYDDIYISEISMSSTEMGAYVPIRMIPPMCETMHRYTDACEIQMKMIIE